MRRVLVGCGPDGRSRVLADDELATQPWGCHLYDLDPAELIAAAGLVPAQDASAIQPAPGAARWIVGRILPYEDELRRLAEDPPPNVTSDGFHITRTVDFDYIVSGELHLDLDDGSVVLRAGDVVVVAAARHAWRNLGSEPAIFLAVLLAPPAEDPS